MRRRFTLFLMLTVAAVVFSPRAAVAQLEELSCDIIGASQLDASGKDAVRAYAAKWMDRFGDDDILVSVDARDALLAPFDCNLVSVAFRIEYGRALRSDLRRYVNGSDERLAFNACRLAGAIADKTSLDILEDALDADRPGSVRCGGAVGYADLLKSVARGEVTLSNASRTLNGVAERMSEENEPIVVQTMLMVFDATRADPVLNADAMAAMSRGVNDLTRRLRDDNDVLESGAWDRTLFLATDQAFQAMVRLAVAPGANTRDFARAAVLMSGQLYAYVRDRSSAAGSLSSSEAALLTQLVGAADNLVNLAHDASGASDASPARTLPAWERTVETDEPRHFEQAVDLMIGDGGRLFRSPYDAEPSDY